MRNLKINAKIKLSVLALSLAGLSFSCSDFLDTPPKDIFTDSNFWTSENNVKTYSWLNYDTFLGYGNNSGTTADFYFHNSNNFDDNLAMNVFTTFNTTANATNANWNSYYTLIRRCNLMLERVPAVSMEQAKKNHYLGVAKFFRAFSYFRLAQEFGDVPYTDAYLNQDDAKVYKPALSRAEVINNVIKDLEEATTLMLPIDDKNITVNKYTAYALLSRVALYEGTNRKYNLAQPGTQYLQKAKDAALAVMNNAAYKLNPDWKSLYNSLELLNNTEVILGKRYLRGVLGNSIQAYTNTSTVQSGLSKFAAESYTTINGLPVKQIGGNAEYLGDNTITNVFANRDPRFAKAFGNVDYAYSDKPLNGLTSITGYVFQLYNNPAATGTEVTTIGQNQIDAPIFTLSEVYLNYAEACAELGTATNADLNLSINKVKARAGIATLTTDGSNASVGGIQINDPQRTSALEQISGVVSPLIWEIRRERRLEFMSWTSLRKADILRWKKGDYLDGTKNPDVLLGARIPSLIGTASKTKVDANGYVIPYTVSRTFIAPKHYLSAIPTNDISLFLAEGVELKQNPGW
ncbi:RagB/SusD family nutrient uptake outer membrane protein [Flavobacterium sp. P4023]|uniref:RagB/SusD family nutrient uptake outer membrane protein n=1 Tax=Flavobacterium flabelliforme TaxID=2816119 RepID=A0ABS5CU16_9FLAO|nr:RagB/SusD family nutrient uptake outer membrane protein [Flavobacterium flabelliforme]MBP4142112.1 RagB/SusD family nutrient uptake outer membrane protein [Flavobacterium flabelliforme]